MNNVLVTSDTSIARDQRSLLFNNVLEANKRERICYNFAMSKYAPQKSRVCFNFFSASLPYGEYRHRLSSWDNNFALP